jgi:hypothetical protein
MREKQSKAIIQTGDPGHRYGVHAHIAHNDHGVTLEITTVYEATRNPKEHRTVFKQHFPSQEDFNRFVDFMKNF